MIIIDKALERLALEGRCISVAIIGLGFIGRAIARQVERTTGMEVVVIGDRDNWREVCKSPDVGVVVDATGDVEAGAEIALAAIRNHKHIIEVNAELDATIGPILKKYADTAGVIYTACDGDQPGVTMNLYRQVKGMGFRPLLCGNIKTFQDVHANPDTMEKFARETGQKPTMITSFADGTKIAIEQAIIANGTGMRVHRRGMVGPTVENGTPIQRAAGWYSYEQLFTAPGTVDYVIGAHPAPGVFVIASEVETVQRRYLKYYKMGPGPAYVFYTPYHLCHFEAANSIARAVLFNDATLAPLDGPRVDVITVAKRDLKAGQVLDGIGGYDTYGLCENYNTAVKELLLPIGLSKGCRLLWDVPQYQAVTYGDVCTPNTVAHALRRDQNDRWRVE